MQRRKKKHTKTWASSPGSGYDLTFKKKKSQNLHERETSEERKVACNATHPYK